MQLIAIWHNATRTKQERTRVELEVRDYILEACSGVEQAFKCHNIHYTVAYQQPNTEWHRITTNAFNFACRNLTPWETTHFCCSLKFIP